MRQTLIDVWDDETQKHKPQFADVILGPDSDQDGWFLIQKKDGTFWTFVGSISKGWFGGSPAPWEART